jgi:hypothetical protein
MIASSEQRQSQRSTPINFVIFYYLLPLADIGYAGRLSAATEPHQRIKFDIAVSSEEAQFKSYPGCARFRQSIFFDFILLYTRGFAYCLYWEAFPSCDSRRAAYTQIA